MDKILQRIILTKKILVLFAFVVLSSFILSSSLAIAQQDQTGGQSSAQEADELKIGYLDDLVFKKILPTLDKVVNQTIFARIAQDLAFLVMSMAVLALLYVSIKAALDPKKLGTDFVITILKIIFVFSILYAYGSYDVICGFFRGIVVGLGEIVNESMSNVLNDTSAISGLARGGLCKGGHVSVLSNLECIAQTSFLGIGLSSLVIFIPLLFANASMAFQFFLIAWSAMIMMIFVVIRVAATLIISLFFVCFLMVFFPIVGAWWFFGVGKKAFETYVTFFLLYSVLPGLMIVIIAALSTILAAMIGNIEKKLEVVFDNMESKTILEINLLNVVVGALTGQTPGDIKSSIPFVGSDGQWEGEAGVFRDSGGVGRQCGFSFRKTVDVYGFVVHPGATEGRSRRYKDKDCEEDNALCNCQKGYQSEQNTDEFFPQIVEPDCNNIYRQYLPRMENDSGKILNCISTYYWDDVVGDGNSKRMTCGQWARVINTEACTFTMAKVVDIRYDISGGYCNSGVDKIINMTPAMAADLSPGDNSPSVVVQYGTERSEDVDGCESLTRTGKFNSYCMDEEHGEYFGGVEDKYCGNSNDEDFDGIENAAISTDYECNYKGKEVVDEIIGESITHFKNKTGEDPTYQDFKGGKINFPLTTVFSNDDGSYSNELEIEKSINASLSVLYGKCQKALFPKTNPYVDNYGITRGLSVSLEPENVGTLQKCHKMFERTGDDRSEVFGNAFYLDGIQTRRGFNCNKEEANSCVEESTLGSCVGMIYFKESGTTELFCRQESHKMPNGSFKMHDIQVHTRPCLEYFYDQITDNLGADLSDEEKKEQEKKIDEALNKADQYENDIPRNTFKFSPMIIIWSTEVKEALWDILISLFIAFILLGIMHQILKKDLDNIVKSFIDKSFLADDMSVSENIRKAGVSFGDASGKRLGGAVKGGAKMISRSFGGNKK